MNYQTKFFLGLCLWILLFTPVYAEQVILTPLIDATLYEDDEGDLANGSGNHLFFGRTGGTGGERLRRALIKFDVSSILADAVIESVNISFEINNAPAIGAVGGSATLHRVTASWNEGASIALGQEGTGAVAAPNDATWLHRNFSDILWNNAGGDFTSTPSGEAGYGTTAPELLEFTSSAGLRADVTAWVRNPPSNHGWVLLGREDDTALTARRVYARESTGQNVPTLTVDYSIPLPTDKLSLTEVASSLTRPVAITNANDGSGRVFIVEQGGRIRIFDTATQTLLATPYLDISSIVNSAGNEQGLLGLAFHPDFANNRRFYVYYILTPVAGQDPTNTPGSSVVAMYEQNAGSPNLAINTETRLLQFSQDATNHNGGDLHFGIDGYLYIASGDGGASNDSFNNAQNVNTLKGKLLRIDVDAAPPGDGDLCGGVNPQYGIPPGNAFPGNGNGCDEILHMGLRNPWKFSFDAQTEALYIGDVGQGNWEEVNFLPVGASSTNFGWPCKEGTNSFRNDVICPNAVDPVFEYSSGTGSGNCSITGGYVYRGSATALTGYYLYGDFCSNRIWLARNLNGTWTSLEWPDAASTLSSLSAFGQDQQCELYVADLDAGKVFRIDDNERVQRSGFESLRCQ